MGFDAGGGALGVLAGIALAIVFALSLSWAWIALGLVLRSPSAVMSLGFVILMPLAFMSNIFVDVDTLPSWLQTFTEINPITHVVTAERGLIHGTATARPDRLVAARHRRADPDLHAAGAVPAAPAGLSRAAIACPQAGNRGARPNVRTWTGPPTAPTGAKLAAAGGSGARRLRPGPRPGPRHYVLASLLANRGWSSVILSLATSVTSVIALTSSHSRPGSSGWRSGSRRAHDRAGGRRRELDRRPHLLNLASAIQITLLAVAMAAVLRGW